MAPPAQGARRGRLINRLFVYGTLVPGGEAWPVLERWTTGAPRADSAAGELYDTGRGYPAATFATGAVHGAVVELATALLDDALAQLDRYEGHEYERIIVRTGGGTDAFTYAWIAPQTALRRLPEGRWPLS